MIKKIKKLREQLYKLKSMKYEVRAKLYMKRKEVSSSVECMHSS